MLLSRIPRDIMMRLPVTRQPPQTTNTGSKGATKWVLQFSAKRSPRSATGRCKQGKEPRAPEAAEAFGSLVFNDEMQQERLPKTVYQALRRTITRGESLDPSVADAVASAVKDWAVEHGATHYTHWFQPLTGITAEKHDSFLNPTATGKPCTSSPARSW